MSRAIVGTAKVGESKVDLSEGGKFMNKYGVVHTTNLSGCFCYDFQATTDVENGALVTKGDLVNGERNIYAATVPATATLGKLPVYLVAHPAWQYEDTRATDQNEDNYINKAGVAFRVYELKPNKRFKITDYSIDPIDASTPIAVGQYVGLQNASTKMKASAAEPTGSAFVGIVRAVDDYGFPFCIGSAGTLTGESGEYGYTVGKPASMVLIEVIRNGETTANV